MLCKYNLKNIFCFIQIHFTFSATSCDEPSLYETKDIETIWNSGNGSLNYTSTTRLQVIIILLHNFSFFQKNIKSWRCRDRRYQIKINETTDETMNETIDTTCLWYRNWTLLPRYSNRKKIKKLSN